jgi:hypothetical protein
MELKMNNFIKNELDDVEQKLNRIKEDPRGKEEELEKLLKYLKYLENDMYGEEQEGERSEPDEEDGYKTFPIYDFQRLMEEPRIQ